jgi:hypothetical protein
VAGISRFGGFRGGTLERRNQTMEALTSAAASVHISTDGWCSIIVDCYFTLDMQVTH